MATAEYVHSGACSLRRCEQQMSFKPAMTRPTARVYIVKGTAYYLWHPRKHARACALACVAGDFDVSGAGLLARPLHHATGGAQSLPPAIIRYQLQVPSSPSFRHCCGMAQFKTAGRIQSPVFVYGGQTRPGLPRCTAAGCSVPAPESTSTGRRLDRLCRPSRRRRPVPLRDAT